MSDEIQEGDPDLPRRKKPLPRDDDDEPPRKKRRPRDDDDDEFERKRKRIPRDDGGDVAEAALGAVVPLGTSIWALLSLYLSLLSCVIPCLWGFSLIFGILAFVTHKHKATYGSITGNIRAVIGIIISLIAMVLHIVILAAWYMSKQ